MEKVGVPGNAKLGGGAQAPDVHLGGGELCSPGAAASGARRTVPRPLRTGVCQPLRRWDAAGSQNVEKNSELELIA